MIQSHTRSPRRRTPRAPTHLLPHFNHGGTARFGNNRDKNYTVTKVAKRMEQVDASIARYLAALDQADRQDSDLAEARTERINEKIAGLRRQMQALKAMELQVQAAPDRQVSLTDPDARSMATSGRGTGMVGYNVQTAALTPNHAAAWRHDIPSSIAATTRSRRSTDSALLMHAGLLRRHAA